LDKVQKLSALSRILRLTGGRQSMVGYFLGAGALLVLFWVQVDPYLEASDPWLYARDAWRLADGKFFVLSDPHHPFTHRLGLLVPVAALYRLFGVSERSSLLFPLLCALGIIAVVLSALSTPRARLSGVAFALTCVPLLRGSVTLGSDLPVAAWMSAFALCVANRDLSSRDIAPLARRVGAGAAAAAAASLAFLAKEIAIWLGPFVVAVFILDLRRCRVRSLATFYLSLVGGLALFAVGYAWFCWHAWGDPWVRFSSIEHIASFHNWGKRPSWLTRLTVEPPAFFFGQFGLVGVAAMVGLVTLPGKATTWKVYTFVMVAFVWLSPTSLSRLAPLPLDSRFALPCVPGIIVLAALLVEHWSSAGPRWNRGALALALGAAFLGVRPYATRTLRSYAVEKDAMRLIVDRARDLPSRPLTLVCADPRSPEYVLMYFGFRPPPQFRAVFLPEYLASRNTTQPSRTLGFVNETRSKFLTTTYGTQTYDSTIDRLSTTSLLDKSGIRLSRLSE
jgi:hypothetical protein